MQDRMDAFFKSRDALIDQLEAGRISKTRFIEENYKFVMTLDLQPFEGDLDDQQCIYNYQYYNLLAKYENLKAQEVAYYDSNLFEEHMKISEAYYQKKDLATQAFLKFVDYKNVKAYFLNLDSKRLEGQLFEVVFLDYKRAIFHSMDQKILKALREHGVFSPVYKPSIIQDYVNSAY